MLCCNVACEKESLQCCNSLFLNQSFIFCKALKITALAISLAACVFLLITNAGIERDVG